MIKNIIFDFDGVILDSVPIKTEAFRKLFEDYPSDKIEILLEYHRQNGGISRYVKIRYFFEKILNESISKERIQFYAQRYSELTKEELSNSKYLIGDSINFVIQHHAYYNMHIASGADSVDLLYICRQLFIDKYFISIEGSPKPKTEILKDILIDYDYDQKDTIMIGDSINDYEAAERNGVVFFGYNNLELSHKEFKYLTTMNDVKNSN